MTKESMSIHKALSELKIIEDRINKAKLAITFATANKASNSKISGMSIEEFKKNMAARYQALNDIVSRRDAIKRAVLISNATTTVNIAGKDFTVAEAIDMHNCGIEIKASIMNLMASQYNREKNKVDVFNQNDLQELADKHTTGMFSSKESANADAIKKTREDYIANNTLVLIDPIGADDEIARLEKYISDFKVEVDAALSVSNAVTNIEISY